MAYNFYLRPPPVQLHGDYKNDRLDIFINTHLDNYDIFALTETFGTLTSRRERLLDAAAARGIKYWAHGPERNWWKGKFVDSGLLVMSRFPIMVIDSVEYGIGLGPDAVAAKGIVYAQINVADKEHNVHKVHLFVSHLQATYIPDEDGNDLTTDTTVLRHAQFQFFRTYLSTTLSTNHYNSSLDTVLLAGDFNTPGAPFGWLPHEDSAEYTRMLLTLSTGGAKVTDVYRQRYGEQKPTWKPWKVVLGEEEERKEEDPQSWGKRLDYLLQWEGGVKQGGRTRLRLGVDQTALQPFKVEGTPFAQLSDHSAVTSVLNFTD
ncbi:Endonuclease/exonuclease/phosphatase [Fimicolochytrium jonesii]|uniref:Endonuclease/exonuclease/phosphatase n=1 Tax=Fimicolochytrium jonesii TaxID=1396493 RepID=UPI0022FE72DA|nr:Endonuclease/exonuclease/phosphatase [Fimicolochytrium jonesii]KAI8817140.1 Endonuclease/exonuclease/phosphatase [Fimicolochytrium jonesii]